MDDWTRVDAVIATHAYFTSLIESLLPGTSAATYMQWLLAQRYDLLVLHHQLPVNQTEMIALASACHGGHTTMVQRAIQRFGKGQPAFQRGLRKLIPLFERIRKLAKDTPHVPEGNHMSVSHLLLRLIDGWIYR